MLDFDNVQVQHVLDHLDYFSPQYKYMREIMNRIDYDNLQFTHSAPTLIQNIEELI